MVYTYLLKSLRTGSFYFGISKDPQKRLIEHNKGRVTSTSKNKPYEIVFYKGHENYSQARRNEIWLKKKNVVYKNRLVTIGRVIPPIQTG